MKPTNRRSPRFLTVSKYSQVETPMLLTSLKLVHKLIGFSCFKKPQQGQNKIFSLSYIINFLPHQGVKVCYCFLPWYQTTLVDWHRDAVQRVQWMDMTRWCREDS